MSTPTPGSDDAIEQGCTCPVMDNNHGRGAWWPRAPVYWISQGCPLHAVKENTDEPVHG